MQSRFYEPTKEEYQEFYKWLVPKGFNLPAVAWTPEHDKVAIAYAKDREKEAVLATIKAMQSEGY